MSSSPVAEPSSPSATSPPSPALHTSRPFQTSTPNYIAKAEDTGPTEFGDQDLRPQPRAYPARRRRSPSLNLKKPQQPPLTVILPAPATPPIFGEPTLTPPPRSPGASVATPLSGDGRSHPPDGTSSDKSSETAVVGVSRTPSTALSRKESYKAQRQHYRREKKRVASALLHSIEDPSVVVLADWLKVRGSLKSWTKLWCVLKPGLLLLYKTPKAKVRSSHWVGTVLLTSCQVIERPSKKDGFCFKLYHPLEQSIWAPRGPHNETIGAVVQPLPTAHLIFRAPSPAAGHCWLDGLELALRCSNAMLRCSRSRPEYPACADAAPATQTNVSHEELERHFNEHAALMSVADYSPSKPSSSEIKVGYQIASESKPTRKLSKWAQFVESIEILSKDNEISSDSLTPETESHGFLDFFKRDVFERNTPLTSSVKPATRPRLIKETSKSLTSSPIAKRTPILKYFDIPKLPLTLRDKINKDKSLSPSNIVEENLLKFMTAFPKRRSSTPSTTKSVLAQKHISDLRESGVKTDSENDDFRKCTMPKKKMITKGGSEVICASPENIIITKTAPSIERFRKYSSSSTDEICDITNYRQPPYHAQHTPEKYSLIDYRKLPSASLDALRAERRDGRLSAQSVYVAGKIVHTELAGAASDTDSEGSHGVMPETQQQKEEAKKQQVLERIRKNYVEDPDREIGAAGEIVEEVAEENKSLLWFLLKQVRPGMDLSKVVLPTFILEPRSFLDKLSDSYYHSDILAQTNNMDDPYLRFKTVLRWYLSGLYKKPKGLKKPYNPVLGETFRCCWKHTNNDSYTFYVAEQVSHHPPVSAFYVSNREDGFVIEGSLLARSKFYGNSTSAILEGCARVHLLNWNETYITTAPYAHCKGIVIGSLSMELGGKVHIMCINTGYHADVEFKLRSFLGSSEQTNSLKGHIKKGKDSVATVEGYWDGQINIKEKKTGEEHNLLDVGVLKEQRMTRYLMRLDHQTEFESQRLWNKVSEAIAAEDQRAATEQKTIIEEAQRVRARNLVAPWVPRFFHKDLHVSPPEGIHDQGWRYSHGNVNPWQVGEIIEFEEQFVIKSLISEAGSLRPSIDAATGLTVASRQHLAMSRQDVAGAASRHRDLRRDSRPDIDTDSQEDVTKKAKRTLKQSLIAIDTALRDQTTAIERLSKTVESISESQRAAAAFRPQNIGRVPTSAHSWDLFGGFVLALVLQAMLNWIFYHKD